MRLGPGYAGFLSIMAALALPKLAWSQERDISPAARAHFAAGLNYVDDPEGPRYEEAYREFRAAYEASPSWKILGNLGTCAFYLERDGEAITAYEKYLSEGGDRVPPKEREQIEKDLATLKVSAVWLMLSVEPIDATVTDARTPTTGAPVVNRYTMSSTPTTLGIHPGDHRITVSAPGYEVQVWEFEAKPGESRAREIRLQPEQIAEVKPIPARSAPPRTEVASEPTTMTHVYVAAAGTAALLTGATVTGVLALSKKSDYDAANGVDGSDAASLRTETVRLAFVTDVLLGASLLAAAGTTYLYFNRDPGLDEPRDQPVAAVDLQGAVTPSGGWLGVRGRF